MERVKCPNANKDCDWCRHAFSHEHDWWCDAPEEGRCRCCEVVEKPESKEVKDG